MWRKGSLNLVLFVTICKTNVDTKRVINLKLAVEHGTYKYEIPVHLLSLSLISKTRATDSVRI